MYGAREYASMFNTGQRGRLFLVSGSHARGKTFNIWLLPSEDRIVGMPWAVKDTVEVYGVVGGQPGWTESYGWLHRGKWEQDFAALVEKRKAEIEEYKAQKEREKANAEEKERARVAQLLSSY